MAQIPQKGKQVELVLDGIHFCKSLGYIKFQVRILLNPNTNSPPLKICHFAHLRLI